MKRVSISAVIWQCKLKPQRDAIAPSCEWQIFRSDNRNYYLEHVRMKQISVN